MQKGLESLMQLIYPRRCPVCEQIVLPKGSLICKECYQSLQFIKEPCCKKCGKPIGKEETEYCYDCMTKKFHYEYGYGMLVYDQKMMRSIASYKYKYKREYGDFYISEMLRRMGDKILRMGVDVVIPVPLHKKKLKQRGYNQAAILAKGIAEGLKLPYEEHLLKRCVNTKPQKLLNDKERFKNLEHAFELNPAGKFPYRGKKVLLIDDIYTTGSTIEVCSNVLLGMGVEKVYFASLCIGKGY